MASVQTYNLKPCKSGRTFPGVAFTVKVNGSAKNLAGVTIKMNIGGTIFSNTSGEIVITDEAGGRFQVKSQIITLPPFTYNYDMTFEDSVNVNTYIKGTWKIT